jgi:hypothetical protein
MIRLLPPVMYIVSNGLLLLWLALLVNQMHGYTNDQASRAVQAVGPTGFVLSVEPAPLTAAALAANLQQHSSWCSSQGRQLARHAVVQAAVGDGSTAEAMLTVYPG